ncbi:beta-lactamase family protein [Flavobacteriaceae bacterium]|nr:beta-lactamase family protein [Flavobacteriaceae bacterium]
MKKFITYFFGAVLLTFLLVYISPYNFLLIAAQKLFETGRDTAFLEDYAYFDNRVVEAAENVAEWPLHQQYNTIPLSDKIEAVHSKYRSVAYLVIHKDSLLHESYFEGYDASSKSNSFSVAKSFVSAMLGKAIEQGYIKSLDQKVSDFYPQFGEGKAAQLTVGDLSSMASGLDWNEKYDLSVNGMMEAYITPNLDRLLLNTRIVDEPGQAFRYLSGNTQLLGMIITKAVGQSLSAYFTEHFWQPMGAKEDALWQLDSEENGMEKAYCCFASNARDFARMGKLYKDYGEWDGTQLLDSAFIALSTRPRFEESPEYGYGWWLTDYNGEKGFAMRGHLGQYIIVFPTTDLIIVRLGHMKGPKLNRFGTQPFHDYIQEGFEMINNVSQP